MQAFPEVKFQIPMNKTKSREMGFLCFGHLNIGACLEFGAWIL
jgi:hypothetical protein